MVNSEVQRLLGRVRSRLWHGHLVAAIRNAMWVSAALMLLAVAAHLAARRVPAEAVLLVLSGLWAGLLLRAGWQRPADSACALWADRQLGGACAFTTLLELDQGSTRICQRAGLAMARKWATGQVASQRGTSGRAAGFDAPVAAAAIDAGVHGAGHHRAGATGHRACVEAASCGGVAIRHWRRDSAARQPPHRPTGRRDCERVRSASHATGPSGARLAGRGDVTKTARKLCGRPQPRLRVCCTSAGTATDTQPASRVKRFPLVRDLSAVDFFDALISERPLQRPVTALSALDLLQQEAGKALDPKVVATFVRFTEARRRGGGRQLRPTR